MTDFENTFAEISLGNVDGTQRRLAEEVSSLRCGRELIYAPVDNPKMFVSDMKPNAGRLMDFNKGMKLSL
jgi:hypothetical protein